MKKLVVLISAAMISFAGLAAVPPTAWVVTGKDRINCEKIHFGISNARITLQNGEKLVVSLKELESYCLNGFIFDKKVLHKNGSQTAEEAFMQLLKKRGNLSLYRNVEFDPESNDPLVSYDVFYIYQGEDMYLKLDEKTMPNVLKYFGLKWSYR
jgi:hypothetical protein